MNTEQIQAEAKKIMDNFAQKLEKVKIVQEKEKRSLGGFREESKAKEPNEEFKKRIFANAPSKEGDFLFAEKKKW